MIRFLSMLILLLGATAAHAQNASNRVFDQPEIVLGDLPEQMTPALLERMCSSAGTMQYSFGQTGVPQSSKLEATLLNGLALPAEMAPFTKAQPRATEWSGQFMEMIYSVQIGQGQEVEDAAWEFIGSLGDIYAEAGWTEVAMDFETTPLYLAGYLDSVAFEKTVRADGRDVRLLLGLDYGIGELTMTCGREDLLKLHAEEAFGNLPEGTPRPEVPVIDVPTVTSAEQCDDPIFVQNTIDQLKENFVGEYMAAMLSRTSYRDRLTQWMLWKLEKSGKITPRELFEITIASAGDASPGGNPFAAMEMIVDFLPVIDGMAKADESGDPAALCLSMVPFQEFIQKADAITLAQTEAVHRTLQAEANRLGVSLD